MLRIHRRLAKGMEVLDYYVNKEWKFDNSNCEYLWSIISEKENYIYKVNAKDFTEATAMEFFENGILGARRYLLHQPDETLPSARRWLTM
jgi:alcohol-forming fatty acyl-CoA reductase